MAVPGVPKEPDEAQRLAALHRLRVLDTGREQSFDRITDIAARVFQAPIALISLVDLNRQWFKARHGLDATETPRAVSFCSHAITQPDVFIVLNAAQDPRFANNPLVTGELSIRFYAGAPLTTSEGHRLGTLCVIDQLPRPGVSRDEREILRGLAATVVELLELRAAADASALALAPGVHS